MYLLVIGRGRRWEYGDLSKLKKIVKQYKKNTLIGVWKVNVKRDTLIYAGRIDGWEVLK